MDDLLELLLKNPEISVRFDTFPASKSIRLKFWFDGKTAEEFIKLPAASDPDGGFLLRQVIAETVELIRIRWKLGLPKK